MANYKSVSINALEKCKMHDHLCHIYETGDDQVNVALDFLHIGLERGEKCALISDEKTTGNIVSAIKTEAFELEAAMKHEQLTIVNMPDSSLKDGGFDPDDMIKMLEMETNSALSKGYAGLRVFEDMTWLLEKSFSAKELIEYEAKINRFFSKNKALAICQYNRSRIDDQIILDLISSHPLILFSGQICRNFYYIPPKNVLEPESVTDKVDRQLNNILARQTNEIKLEKSKIEQKDINARLNNMILEHERMEKTLRDSELRYHTLFEHTPLSILEEDFSDVKKYIDQKKIEGVLNFKKYFKENPDQAKHCAKLAKIVDVNIEALNLIGAISKDSLIKYWNQLFNKDYLAMFGEKLAAFAGGKTRFVSQTKHGSLKGGIVVVSVSASIAPGHEETWAKVFVSMNNITERVLAEKRVKENEAQLTLITDALPVLISYIDNKLCFRFNNKGYEEWFEIARAKIKGKKARDILGEEAYSLAKPYYDKALSGQRTNHETLMPFRFGEPRYVHEELVPDIADNGDARGFFSLVTDITQQKKTEAELEKYRNHLETIVEKRTFEINQAREALKENEEQLRLITDNLPVLISYIDSDLRYRFNNKTYEEWYARPIKEITGNFVKNIVEDKTFRSIKKRLDSALSGVKVTFEDRVNFSDGKTRDINISYIPHFNSQQKVKGLFTLIYDITERKNAEKEVKKVHNQLLHSEKLAAIGKLSASIAHEFNNPIYGIRSALECLLDENIVSLLDKQHIKLLNMSLEECARMANLIKSLQDFNRPSEEGSSFINIHNAIDNMVLFCKRRLKKRKISIETKYDVNVPEINVVPDQIKQVLLNMIQNADDAISDKGGNITISTEYVEPDILIHIKDTGSGIKKIHTNSIFEPFFTTKPAVKGTGLGLSICYGIIKKHNGDIKVKSAPEKGTTFTINLPVNT